MAEKKPSAPPLSRQQSLRKQESIRFKEQQALQAAAKQLVHNQSPARGEVIDLSLARSKPLVEAALLRLGWTEAERFPDEKDFFDLFDLNGDG